MENLYKINKTFDKQYENKELSKELFNNYNLLIRDEKFNYLKNIIDDRTIDNLLLNFILYNYHPTETDNFIVNAKQILFKFNKTLNFIEDEEWRLYNFPSERYELDENEFIFENSISYFYKNEIFISKIEQLNRILNELSNNITVKYNFLKDNDNIIFVVFICKIKY